MTRNYTPADYADALASMQPPPAVSAPMTPAGPVFPTLAEKLAQPAPVAPAPNYDAPVGFLKDVYSALVAPEPAGPPRPPIEPAPASPMTVPRGEGTTWTAPENIAPLTPPKAMSENWAPATAPAEEARFALRPGSGAIIPAHEVERRGPTLRAAQGAANEATAGAINDVRDRSVETAGVAYDMARAQAAQGYAREDAAMASAAERDQELQQRQADFDQTVRQMSRASLDPDRFWASRSTGQRISALVSITLGGFLQGVRGGPNPGMDIINNAIERDLRAQEFAYHATRDTAAAKQTAFSMAMQKYQNVDAARAAARASALDAVQAQMGQEAALWKGTDSANHASIAMAQLQQDKANQIAQGIAYVQPAQAPRQFFDRKTGLLYSESEMKAREATSEGQAFEMRKIGAQTEGKLAEEQLKGELAGAAKGRPTEVPAITAGGATLPAYHAASDTDAREDRDARQAGAQLVDMIDSVLAKREKAGLLGRAGAATNPINATWENDVAALGPQIGIAWAKTKKLGTYDKGVENLIGQIQGDPRAIGSTTDDKLRTLRTQVLAGLDKGREAQTGEAPDYKTSLQKYGGK